MEKFVDVPKMLLMIWIEGGLLYLKQVLVFCPPLPTILYIDFSMPVDFRPFYDRHTKAPPIAPRGYLQIFGLVIGEEDDPT